MFPLPGANWSYIHGLRLVATTGVDGFTLQDGTPTILTVDAPDDGNQHWALLFASLYVESAQTGGALHFTFTPPQGDATTVVLSPGNSPAGTYVLSMPVAVAVAPGSTVTVVQSSALTAGSGVINAGIWGM